MSNNEFIINTIKQFSSLDEINSDLTLSESVTNFSSLIRIRLISLWEEKFRGTNFNWINKDTLIIEIFKYIEELSSSNKKNISIKKDPFLYNDQKFKNFPILGIGIDIENINNIPIDIFDKNNINLRSKIFTEREICSSIYKQNYRESLTGIFCAKESAIKALEGTMKISFSDIEVFYTKNKKPFLKVNNLPNNVETYLTISHANDFAIAFCMVSQNI